jgi:hypothetical protein
MSKLRLGETMEISQRIKNLEDTEVVKSVPGTASISDVKVLITG